MSLPLSVQTNAPELIAYHNLLVDYLNNGILHWVNEQGAHCVCSMDENDHEVPVRIEQRHALQLEIDRVRTACRPFTSPEGRGTGKIRFKTPAQVKRSVNTEAQSVVDP